MWLPAEPRDGDALVAQLFHAPQLRLAVQIEAQPFVVALDDDLVAPGERQVHNPRAGGEGDVDLAAAIAGAICALLCIRMDSTSRPYFV